MGPRMNGLESGSSHRGPIDDIPSLLVAVSCHETLKRLSLLNVHLNAEGNTELDALADVALSRRLTSMHLNNCHLGPASLSALARLLHSGTISEFSLGSNTSFEEGVSAEFCAALRRLATVLSGTVREPCLYFYQRLPHSAGGADRTSDARGAHSSKH